MPGQHEGERITAAKVTLVYAVSTYRQLAAVQIFDRYCHAALAGTLQFTPS